MIFKHVFFFFLIIWVIIFMNSFINFNNSFMMILKPNIWFSVLKCFIKHSIFVKKNVFYFFSYWCYFQNNMSWLYPNFFLNFMGFGNLERSIIPRVSFSIIKILSSPSKNALYFSFSFSAMSFVFLPYYFLILFNATSAIFECPICLSTSLILCHNSIMSSFLL